MPVHNHTIHLSMRSANALLPRVLLAFSRRRHRIRHLTYVDCEDESLVRMRVELCCNRQQANEVACQLLRIVEVVEARVGKRVEKDTMFPEPIAV